MPDFNPSEIERKWIKKWKDSKIFESNPDRKKKYFLTVPYPYASGALHVGHARSYTLGDVTARYYRMLGFNVLFPMASHITGTPILAISKKIEQKDEKSIDANREYISYYESNPNRINAIVSSFNKPENVANFYANAIRNDFESMGYAIDWRRFFTTGDKSYNAFIRWQYHHLNKQGYLVKGKHPVFYCSSCGNPVTTDDIKSGDEYGIEMTSFYLIKMKFQDGFIVAATLRPETIFGVVNTWINPNESYVKANVDDEIWYVAEKFVKKLENQQHNVKVMEKYSAKDLLRKKLTVPLANRKVPLLPAEFVDVSIATGVVNSVPAHAPYDYIAGLEIMQKEKIDLTPIPLIKVDGLSDVPARDLVEKEGIKSQNEMEKLEKITQELYKEEFYKGVMNENCQEFEGLRVSKAKEGVIEKLTDMNLISTIYENNIKDKSGNLVKEPKCRCGTTLEVRVLADQWFLDYGNENWKESTRDILENTIIEPEIYRKGFQHTIEWLHEWPCTRNRGLGTKFPLDERWMIESLSDSTIYMTFYTISHLLNFYKIAPEKMTIELFDYVMLGIGDLKEVAKRLKINEEMLQTIRNEFLYWYPMDERRTGTAHISNHLTFMLFHHVAIFPRNIWPKKISLNEMLIAEGRKMSKSFGNVIPIRKSVESFGADTVRLYLIYAADPETTLDWRGSQVENTKKRIVQFYDIVSSIIGLKDDVLLRDIDLWLLSRLQTAVIETRKSLDTSKARRAVQYAFYNLINDFNWYSRRVDKQNPSILKEFANVWIRLMTPFIPFISEELWKRLGNKEFVSNATYPEPDESKINPIIETQEEMIKNLIDDISSIIEVTKIKPTNIYLYIAPEWKYTVYSAIKSEKTIKDIMNDPSFKQYGKEISKMMQTRKDELPKFLLTRDHEFNALREAKNFLEKEFNCNFDVQKNITHDPENKSKYALPMKPGVYIER